MLKKILISLLLLVVIVGVWQRELIYYGISQAKGQLTIVYNARPIDEFLSNNDYPDSLKRKLKLIEEVRQFSFTDLNFAPTENYTKMFDQHGKALMWVVTACDPYSFNPKTWTFPIVGEVPYKGYFNAEMAKKEISLLKSQGYDVGARNPGGWSTLGWFKDPVLSEMLKRSEEQLVELIIHELSHSTIFVKDSVEFNENLASFIAYHGTQKFLKSKFGENDPMLESYLNQEKDNLKLIEHFIIGAQRLDSLYKSFDRHTLEDVSKKMLKDELITDIVEAVDTISFLNRSRFTFNFEEIPNNTYFMSYLRYHSKQDEFESILQSQFDGDIVEFIKFYKSNHPFL